MIAWFDSSTSPYVNEVSPLSDDTARSTKQIRIKSQHSDHKEILEQPD